MKTAGGAARRESRAGKRPSRRRRALAAATLGAGTVAFLGAAMPFVSAIGWAAAHVAVAVAILVAPARWSRAAARAVTVYASIVVAVVVGDLALRPIVGARLGFRPDVLFGERCPRMPDTRRFEPGVDWEHTTYGDLAAMTPSPELREPRNVVFRTDGLGFRNDEDAAREPARVILLGDSFGAGSGVSQEKSWDALLRRRYGIATYNASIVWGSPWEEYARLVLEWDQLRVAPGARIVWAMFEGNDLDEPYYWDVKADQLPRADLWTRLRTAHENWLARSPLGACVRAGLRRPTDGSGDVIVRRAPDGTSVLFYATYAQRRGRTYEDVRNHPSFPGLDLTMHAMADFAAAHGLSVVVVSIPCKERVYAWMLDGVAPAWDAAPSGFSLAVQELASACGMNFVDLTPGLVAAARRAFVESGRLVYWRDDTHWNDEGHAVAAEIVAHVVAGR